MHNRLPLAWLLILLFSSACLASQPNSEDAIPSVTHQGLLGFQHGTVVANGVRLHYVVAGQGEPVILVPGWPESWYAWRDVMPLLVAAGRRVYALDPRGFGDSEKPQAGYDPATSAQDLHAFIEAMGLSHEGGVDIVAHDLGTWIAFSHAERFPGDVRRLVLSEASIPGISPPPSGIPDRATNLKTWHFAFNRLDDLPETLVQGHERAFLTWLFASKSLRGWTIDPTTLDEYVRVYSSPGVARAGFAYYRFYLDDAGLAQARVGSMHRLKMPVLALGGQGGVGGALFKTLQSLGDRVQGGILAGCGHYLPDECPNEFSRAILDFWRSTDPGSAASQ
jgi:pimeloyl-ACP methyl ester carboxylesterase